jgi:hypothetical protein
VTVNPQKVSGPSRPELMSCVLRRRQDIDFYQSHQAVKPFGFITEIASLPHRLAMALR